MIKMDKEVMAVIEFTQHLAENIDRYEASKK
jgi:hypothetical protein